MRSARWNWADIYDEALNGFCRFDGSIGSFSVTHPRCTPRVFLAELRWLARCGRQPKNRREGIRTIRSIRIIRSLFVIDAGGQSVSADIGLTRAARRAGMSAATSAP